MEIEMGSSIPGWMFDPSLLATPFFSPSAVGSVSSGGVPRSESYEGFPIDWTGKPDNGGVAATQREEDITHCMVQRAPRASGCRYVG
ncbi:unnamed protein product [Urochloa humidicola]